MSESPRYSALRTVSRIYRILAIGAGIGTVLTTLLLLGRLFNLGTNIPGSVGVPSMASLYGAFATLTLMAGSEGIQLLLDIEANTRAFNDAAHRVDS